MKRIAWFLATATFLPGLIQAQSDYLLNLYQQDNPLSASVLTTGGAEALVVATDEGRMLWLADSDGNPLWAKRIPDSLMALHLAQGPDDGLYLIGARMRRLSVNWDGSADTLMERLAITSFDAQGEERWSLSLSTQNLIPYESIFDFLRVTGLPLADGRLAVIAQMAASTYADLLHLYIITPSGELAEAHAYGTTPLAPFAAGLFTHPHLSARNCSWALLDDGSMQLCAQSLSSPSSLTARFDPLFTNQWLKRYTYVNNLFPAIASNATPVPNGRFALSWAGTGTDHHRIVRLIVDHAGAVTNRDLYLLPPLPAHRLMLAATAADELAVIGESTSSTYALRTTMDGSLLDAQAAPEWTNGDYSHRLLPHAASAIGAMQRLSCAHRRRHVAFNFVDHFAGNISLPWSSESCIFSALSASRYLIPDSLVTVEDHPPLTRLPLSTAAEPGAPLESAAPPGSLALCAQVVAVSEPSVAPGCQLLSNPATDDRPIRVHASQGHAFKLMDCKGRVARMYSGPRSPGECVLDVRGLSAGLYLLIATPIQGGAIQSMKVVVE